MQPTPTDAPTTFAERGRRLAVRLIWFGEERLLLRCAHSLREGSENALDTVRQRGRDRISDRLPPFLVQPHLRCFRIELERAAVPLPRRDQVFGLPARLDRAPRQV